jgi:hypothetical protein
MPEYLVQIRSNMNPRYLAMSIYTKADELGYNPVVLYFEDGPLLRTKREIKKPHLREIETIPGIIEITHIRH